MSTEIKEALKIAAELERLRRRYDESGSMWDWDFYRAAVIENAKTLFAAIKQLSGEVERLKSRQQVCETKHEEA